MCEKFWFLFVKRFSVKWCFYLKKKIVFIKFISMIIYEDLVLIILIDKYLLVNFLNLIMVGMSFFGLIYW